MKDVTQEELEKALSSWFRLTFEYIKSPQSVHFNAASEWLMDHIQSQRMGNAEAFELDTYIRLHPHKH